VSPRGFFLKTGFWERAPERVPQEFPTSQKGCFTYRRFLPGKKIFWEPRCEPQRAFKMFLGVTRPLLKGGLSQRAFYGPLLP